MTTAGRTDVVRRVFGEDDLGRSRNGQPAIQGTAGGRLAKGKWAVRLKRWP